MHHERALCAPIALVLCTASCISASAWHGVESTIVVDAANGPGAHFTDIPDAVTAAAPGDLVLVRAGEYSPFLLNKAVTILGAPNGASRVSRPSSLPMTVVGGIPAGQVVAIADLEFPSALSVWGTKGTVAVDGCSIGRLIVPLADDVRVYRATHIGRLQAQRSHVEIVSSNVGGGITNAFASADDLGIWGSRKPEFRAEHDWPTVDVLDHSKLVCALTGVEGRHIHWKALGNPVSFELPMTSGTSAVHVDDLSTLALIGTASDAVRGGDSKMQPGVVYFDPYYEDPPRPFFAGHGVLLDSGQASRSGVQLSGGDGGPVPFPLSILWPNFTYDGRPVAGADYQKLVDITPDNPTLELLDTPIPGSKVRLRVRGPVGAEVVVAYGGPTIVAVPATRPIESLVATVDRIRPGNVPITGEMTFDVDIPAAVDIGAHVFLQAHLVLPSGAARASNSVVLVAR